MSLLDTLFWISTAGLLVLSALSFHKSKNRWQLFFRILILAACGSVYYFVFQSSPRLLPKGEKPNQGAFLTILYFCMLLGMLCHYLYTLPMAPKRKREPFTFDLGSFLAPVFVSPLVFIPLYGAFLNADVDIANLTPPKFMIFLVAFENGFFWREVVDNRRKERK